MTSKRRLGLLLALAGTSFTSLAQAQSRTGWALDRFDPSPAGDLFFAADRPWYSGSRTFALRFGVVGDYARLPLAIRTGGQGSEVTTNVVDNMLLFHAQVGIALFDRIGIHLSLPVSAWQSGNEAFGVGPAAGPTVGDPRIGARVRLFGDAERSPISLHVGADLYINAGVFGVPRSYNTTDDQFRGRFNAVAAGRVSIVRYSLGAGFHLRPTTTAIANTTVGNEVYLSAAIGFVALSDRLTIGPEFYASTELDRAFSWTQFNAEVILGAHYLIADTVLIGIGAGPGLTQGAGTPQFRGLFQLAYAPEHRAAPVAAPVDTDGDGVFDPDDQCVTVPAGEHPDATRRGCPMPDSDRDGVFDADDVCVNEPAGEHPDATRRGCPTPDSDHDGVLDPDDQCPTTAAGDHPDPDRRGCPDGDRDVDGVLDHADQCPNEAQGPTPDPNRAGCPIPDRDHDTVPDATDHCPDQPGAPSANPARNGCPGLVQVENGNLRIIRPVFFATNRDRILPRSFPVLLAVADALNASPQIHRVSVEGHTDDVGDDARNLDLSQRRAASVVAFLVAHGIEAGRLEARGYGETRPEQPIEGLRGRALRTARSANRRVAFRITDPAEATPAPAAGSQP